VASYAIVGVALTGAVALTAIGALAAVMAALLFDRRDLAGA
jgi:hypothetical protein